MHAVFGQRPHGHDHIKTAEKHDIICKLCDKEFKNFDNLRKHKREYHGHQSISLYQCKDYGKTFKTKSLERNHIYRIHEVSNDLKCNLCDKPFQNIPKLRKHTVKCIELESEVEDTHELMLESALVQYC